METIIKQIAQELKRRGIECNVISDKYNRLCNLATNPDIDNLGESLEDTLRDPNTFDFGFEVNEVRYPLPTPYYSLRRISRPKQEQPEKQNIQKTLFV